MENKKNKYMSDRGPTLDKKTFVYNWTLCLPALNYEKSGGYPWHSMSVKILIRIKTSPFPVMPFMREKKWLMEKHDLDTGL